MQDVDHFFGPKPMKKFVPWMITKPKTSMYNNFFNKQGVLFNVETANIRETKSLVHPTLDLNLEKIKKLINKYGVPDNVGGKSLVNSKLVPSSHSKYDVVLSAAILPLYSLPCCFHQT